jgi:PAS domain-containing protein
MSTPVPVGNICDDLAKLAAAHGYKTLTMWLKMSANEAYLNRLMTESKIDERIGVWDWDIAENTTYTNAVGGAFFGKRADEAAKGAPLEKYTAKVHPHDAALFAAELHRSIKLGGPFFAEYRVVVGDRMRWLRADGNCRLDPSGRPTRMLGSMVDITRLKRDQLATVQAL